MTRIPTGFLLGIPLLAALMALRIVIHVGDKISWILSPGYRLGTTGAWLVVEALFAAGAFELARRGGRGARAARVAGWLHVAMLAMSVVYVGLEFAQMRWYDKFPAAIWTVTGYLSLALSLAGIAALVRALDGFHAHRVIGVVALVGVVAGYPPPFLQELLFEAGRGALLIVSTTGRAVMLGGLGYLLVRGAPALAELPEDRELGERGYQRAASSLWLRIIAAGSVALVVLMAASSRGGGGGGSLLQLCLVVAPAINAIGLALFGAGAFGVAQSGLRDVARGAATVAGALSVWAAGVVIAQLPWVYTAIYGGGEYGLGRSEAADFMQALAVAVPLVAAAGIVVLATTITGFARRRNLQDLAELASVRTIMFVLLLGASLGVQQVLLPKATTMSGLLGMTVVAAVLGLIAIVTAAKLFRSAADAMREAPGLPVAKVLEPPSS